MDEIVSTIKTEIECLRDLAKARSGKNYDNGREQGSIEVCELLLDFISFKEKTKWMPLDNH